MERKTLLIATGLFLLLVIAIFLALYNSSPQRGQACLKNHCFDVELAITPQEQYQGLMSRESLEPNQGMLFIFEKEGEYPFWMKNTLIPLDIIWINGEKNVVFVSQNTQPCLEDPCPTIEPNEKAKYVLEINGGISKEMGLAVGDKIDIEY